MGPRTSASHPIRVDWLPGEWTGKVGLTFAPGKRQAHPASGPAWERDLGADLERLRSEFEATVLVPLLEDHEFAELGIPDLVPSAETLGLTVWRMPIADGGVPTDLYEFESIIARIKSAAAAGERVVVHCKGGLGRAGTVGGCVLIASGLSAVDALDAVRRARGSNAPETEAQRDFVRWFGCRR